MTTSLDDLLAQARRRIEPRATPHDLAAVSDDGGLIVDIRPVELRTRDGELPGAIVIDRNVLEWRLAPDSAWRIPEASAPSQRIVIVCNEGYASSFAAATLRELGLEQATDLDGGYQAVVRQGLVSTDRP